MFAEAIGPMLLRIVLRIRNVLLEMDVLMDTYASPSPSVPVPHPHRWFHPPVVRRFAEVIILMLLRVVVIILVVPMEMDVRME